MKKILSVLIFAALLLAVSPTAFASESQEIQKAYELVDKANAKIDEEIQKGKAEADELYAKYLAAVAELDKNGNAAAKAEATEKYENERDKIINKVYTKTMEITHKAVAKATEMGLITEIYWVPVTFGDKTVDIDPIRVVGHQ